MTDGQSASLAAIPLFKQLSPEALAKLSALMVTTTHKAGDTIFLTNEPPRRTTRDAQRESRPRTEPVGARSGRDRDYQQGRVGRLLSRDRRMDRAVDRLQHAGVAGAGPALARVRSVPGVRRLPAD